MPPITNEKSVSTSEGMVGKRCTLYRGTLEKDECGLHGSIFQSIIKVHYNKCTCFPQKSIKRNTFSDGLSEKDFFLAQNETINQSEGKKKTIELSEPNTNQPPDGQL